MVEFTEMASRKSVSIGPRLYGYAARLMPKPRTSIFICGCGHSGTTLLARILAMHPQVFSLTYESEAFIGRNSPNLKVLHLLLQSAVSTRPVLVEKTPSHIHYTDRISRVIPGTRFIVATRDGRDTVASLGKRYDGNFRRAFNRWLKDSKASRNRLAAGDSILWRYEDFIASPAASLRQLCDFIGIVFNESMLDYHKNPVVWGPQHRQDVPHTALRNEQVNKPIEDNRGKWKKDLPPEAIAWFDGEEARSLMEYFGYR